MKRNITLASIMAAFIIVAASQSVLADIITAPYPSMAAVIAITDTGGNPSAPAQISWSGYWPTGETNWAFSPNSLAWEGATASQSTHVIYTGSSLMAEGSGAVVGANAAAGASSGFVFSFTPSVNCAYSLSGWLTGDIIQSGWYSSGGVVFTQYAPGLWSYIIAPTSEPTTFARNGTLYAGDNYQFVIGVNPGPSTGTHQGEWGFALSVAPVPLPPALLLFAPGLVGLVGFRRRFKK